MSHLPANVLLSVFNFLVTRDKLECMTVCQQWHDIIQQHSLFHAIYIRHQHQLDQLIKRVKKDPTVGKKVKRLRLDLLFNFSYVAKEFIDYFPNLRDVTMANSSFDREIITARQGRSLCPHITKMVEGRADVNTIGLLNSGLCKNLVHIAVEGQEESVSDLFTALANAPNLKSLHLNYYTISLRDLEQLHENVPQLDSLLLKNVTFEPERYPLNIKPATSMKSFRCISCNFDSYLKFNPHLQYISEKYTHLEELAPQIESVAVEDVNKDAMNSLNQQRSMITSYFKTLGPTLKTLSLSIDNYDKVYDSTGFSFELLDECGCQIENMNFDGEVDVSPLERLSKSMQAQYIQSLTIRNFFNLSENYYSFQWLRYFTALKKLVVFFPLIMNFQETVDITRLLKCRLETLLIHRARVVVDGSSRFSVYPWLKNLTLSNMNFETGTDIFLSRACPNLKHLKLDNCFRGGESFMLPNTNLSRLEIINRSITCAFSVMVITLSDNQQRVYKVNTTNARVTCDSEDVYEDSFTLPSVYSLPFDDSEAIPLVNIVCNTLYDFFMVNTR